MQDAGTTPDTGPLVDCDVHLAPKADRALRERLPERWRDQPLSYPNGNWGGPRAVEDAADLGASYLDPNGVDAAVTTAAEPALRAGAAPDRRYAAAVCTAYNDWLIEEGLAADERLRGSIAVAQTDPARAASEIERVGDHDRIVQVIMGSGTRVSLGNERYWPIYEAACANDLPVAIHAGAEGFGVANPNTAAGFPSTAVERHAVVPANFMGQLLNLVLEGPFVEYPDLRVVLIGCGYSWLPSFCWRIDKCWKGLRDDFPWVERPPSEYVRDHMYVVADRLDEPATPGHVETMLEMAWGEEVLMFGSNYPRWNRHEPDDGLPAVDETLAAAIRADTARVLYGL